MNITKENLVPAEVSDQERFTGKTGFQIDPIKDDAEDLVLDLVDYSANEDAASVETTLDIIAERAGAAGFREAALQTMTYLQAAYSDPGYRQRPDLNPKVQLEELERIAEALRKSLG